MILPKNNTPRWIIILIDIFLSLIGLFFAYLIRFDLKADIKLIQNEWNVLSKSILVFLSVKFLVFYLLKIHKGLVRHTSTEDLRRIFFASLVSSLIFVVLGIIRDVFIDGYYLFPTSVLIIEFLASFILITGLRFVIKLYFLETIKPKE